MDDKERIDVEKDSEQSDMELAFLQCARAVTIVSVAAGSVLTNRYRDRRSQQCGFLSQAEQIFGQVGPAGTGKRYVEMGEELKKPDSGPIELYCTNAVKGIAGDLRLALPSSFISCLAD